MSDYTNEINNTMPEQTGQMESKGVDVEIRDDLDMSVLAGFEDAQGEGDPDLVVELIDLYLEDAPQQLVVMREALSNNDEASLKRSAHNLKGSSSSLGVNGIAALCEKIELADYNNSSQTISPLLNQLEQVFERVRRVFVAERLKRSGRHD